MPRLLLFRAGSGSVAAARPNKIGVIGALLHGRVFVGPGITRNRQGAAAAKAYICIVRIADAELVGFEGAIGADLVSRIGGLRVAASIRSKSCGKQASRYGCYQSFHSSPKLWRAESGHRVLHYQSQGELMINGFMKRRTGSHSRILRAIRRC